MKHRSSAYAIQERAVSENPDAGPQGKGWQEDIAFTLEARNKVQAVAIIDQSPPRPANDNKAAATVVGIGLTYLSVCSGIEAATVAWEPLGWKAIAYSEIEKFTSLVLRHHYPGVPNLGDFTKIDTRRLGRVDILCGGTPCQAFSVAGLRQSLADARGNLSLEFVRLAHELADGNGLRNVVWENVVGVLSTKDNAFGCFLAGLVGADAAIEPPARGKWPRHGMVSGPKGRAAWAVKDAQFFGVAQRRRRVLVVADFGNGADPAAVLFEPESVLRHPPTRGEAGKDIAPTISARTKGGGGLGTDFDLDGGLIESAVASVGNRTSGPLDVATAVNAHGGPHGRLDFESETFIHQTVASLDASYGRLYGASGQDANHGHSHLVAFGQNSRDEVRLMNGDGQIVGALAAEPGAKQQCYVAQTVAIRGRDGGATAELGGEVATALRASQGGGDKPHVLAAIAFNARQDPTHRPIADALGTKDTGHGALINSAVRRLTPMECERLQGFPDGYTRIPLRAYGERAITKNRPGDMWEFITDADGKGQWWLMSADGPRYKALGNSWAVPKFAWLGRRIQMLMPKEKPAAANDNDGEQKAA